jgi:YbgC/YbaW family acyl-CoA thioester hydrolase
MVHKEPGSHPDPEQPAFETFFRVRFHEVDSLGHVNNAAYLNYVEQAAIDHATFLGLDLQRLQRLGGVFVARRHEIEFLKPTFAGDVLRVVTWLDEPRGARVDRRYLVFREPSSIPEVVVAGRPMPHASMPPRDGLVARATTEWVFANNQGQPRRIPDEIARLFRAGMNEGTAGEPQGA